VGKKPKYALSYSYVDITEEEGYEIVKV